MAGTCLGLGQTKSLLLPFTTCPGDGRDRQSLDFLAENPPFAGKRRQRAVPTGLDGDRREVTRTQTLTRGATADCTESQGSRPGGALLRTIGPGGPTKASGSWAGRRAGTMPTKPRPWAQLLRGVADTTHSAGRAVGAGARSKCWRSPTAERALDKPPATWVSIERLCRGVAAPFNARRGAAPTALSELPFPAGVVNAAAG